MGLFSDSVMKDSIKQTRQVVLEIQTQVTQLQEAVNTLLANQIPSEPTIQKESKKK